jgi:2-dehydropantoate 2-reductase
MTSTPTIAIVGSGAIGGYYGARLAQHGHNVHFLLRSDFDAVMREGWTIHSIGGDFNLRPNRFHAHRTPKDFPLVDLVVVTLKSTADAHYEGLIGPLLGADTAILTLQNGLGNEEALAARFGASRILGGLAWICSTRTAPGAIGHTFGGRIQLSDFTTGPSARARWVADLFNKSNVEAEVLADIRTGKWRKLAWNIAFSGLGSLLGLSTDRLLGDQQSVQFVNALMAEVVEIAKARGIAVPDEFISEIIPFTRKMGVYRTSMQIDRENSRPMELGAIFAQPLQFAREFGVPTPRLSTVYELLSLIDRTNAPLRP